MPTQFLLDQAVDQQLDADLRALLSSCFTGPQDHVFRTQRFFHRAPQLRWLRRDERGLTVHLAAHDLIAGHATGEVRFAGIAEVCVRSDCRGQGLVRQVLAEAHVDLAAAGFEWAALLGKPEVYGSSGYRATGQPLRHLKQGQPTVEVFDSFQVRQLHPNAPAWPTGELDLRGPLF